MKVLVISGSYPPMKCGVGAYTKKLVEALSEFKDLSVTVFTDIRVGETSSTEKYDVLPIMDGWGITKFTRIADHVKKFNPDVIHIQSPTMGYPGRIPLLLPLFIHFLGKPLIQTWHEPVSAVGGLCRSVGMSVLITVREELQSNFSRLAQKAMHHIPIYWIPAGCMLPRVVLSDKERSLIRRQFTTGSTFLLIYYGFVAPLKGIEALLEVVANTDTHLLLACDLQNENSYHRFLLDRMKSMGLMSRIVILGFVQDAQLSKYLAAADAVVLPFRDGARNCNTTVEGALAQGTFVLTTSNSYHGYYGNKNIYYATPGNITEMIDAINQYSGTRNETSGSSCNWNSVAEQHREIYRQVVSK